MKPEDQDKAVPLGHEFRPFRHDDSVGNCVYWVDDRGACGQPASAHKAEEPVPTDPWFARPCIGPPGHRELGHEAEDGRCKWCGLPEPTAPPYCHCRLSGVRHIHDEEHGIIAAPEPADKAAASNRAEFEAKAMELAADTLLNMGPQDFQSRRDKIVAIILNSAAWLRDAEAAARAEEREECAKVLYAVVRQHREEQEEEYRCGPPKNKFCEEYGCYSLEEFAAAIRARTSKP